LEKQVDYWINFEIKKPKKNQDETIEKWQRNRMEDSEAEGHYHGSSRPSRHPSRPLQALRSNFLPRWVPQQSERQDDWKMPEIIKIEKKTRSTKI